MNRQSIRGAFLSLLGLLFAVSCVAAELIDIPTTATTSMAASRPARPAEWAVALNESDDLPNAFRITKSLYRGAQPTAQGMRDLEKMGVRTIVNLRSFHSDRSLIKGTKLDYEHIYMKAWHPEYKELVKFLKIVTDKKRTPVFFHCQHGADRTGTMCAVYRMAVQDWTADAAIEEMTKGGYNFHAVFQNLLDYVKSLDIERLRKDAGIILKKPV